MQTLGFKSTILAARLFRIKQNYEILHSMYIRVKNEFLYILELKTNFITNTESHFSFSNNDI